MSFLTDIVCDFVDSKNLLIALKSVQIQLKKPRKTSIFSLLEHIFSRRVAYQK